MSDIQFDPQKNNEPIYDEQISPLMQRILAICKEHNIPMVASFEFHEGDYCSSMLAPDEAGSLILDLRRAVDRSLKPSIADYIITAREGGGNDHL